MSYIKFTYSKSSMAQWHLDQLENALHQAGWRITERTGVDKQNLSLGTWKIERAQILVIHFDGILDGIGRMIKQPSIEKAYSCQIVEQNAHLYFYKKGKQWEIALEQFIGSLISPPNIINRI